MRAILEKRQRLVWPGGSCRAVIGSGGLIAETKKREGDGASPIGCYVLRRVLYRADRLARPKTTLPIRALLPDDGWCDAPNDIAYNRPVRLPYAASAETLFRTDHVYDLLVVLGHNDRPPISGLGSAVFLHLARKNWTPTRGCIAVCETPLRQILEQADATSTINISLD